MKFRTEIAIPESSWKIDHSTKGIAIGSCFTDYIGNMLHTAKFPISVNPFGTVYNPASIANSFELLYGSTQIDKSDVILNAGLWTSFYLHSSFSAESPEKVLANSASRIAETQKLQPIDYALITLGTAWVYVYKKSGKIVSNCHKFPAGEFTRKRLSVAETETSLTEIIRTIRTESPECRIIFTISPIRHWKDGAHENQVSKSTLFLAIDTILSEEKNIHYFPAYEILMDELRDYRFYAEDMLHPNATAVQYIQEQFCKTYFSHKTRIIQGKIEAILRAMQHRPFHTKSTEYKKFIETSIHKIEEIQKQNPTIDVSKELRYFSDTKDSFE
ncbi:MAG: GSCFA domain-containing protein [Bacteroidales bacterium]